MFRLFFYFYFFLRECFWFTIYLWMYSTLNATYIILSITQKDKIFNFLVSDHLDIARLHVFIINCVLNSEFRLILPELDIVWISLPWVLRIWRFSLDERRPIGRPKSPLSQTKSQKVWNKKYQFFQWKFVYKNQSSNRRTWLCYFIL